MEGKNDAWPLISVDPPGRSLDLGTPSPLGLARSMLYVVVCISALDLMGWALRIPLLTSVFPHYATMKPNTAVCLGLLAVASLITSGPDGDKRSWRPWVAGGFEGAALTLSGLSLVEYLTGRSLGLDQWILRVAADNFLDPAGRMSVGTAISLTATAGAYLLRNRLSRISVWLLITGALVSVSGLVGFLFDAGPLAGVPWLKSLAVHTAAGLLLLQLAELASHPEREPYRSLNLSWRRDGHRRYLLFAVTLLPLMVALPVVLGLRLGLYDPYFSLALLLVLLLCVQSWMFWADNKTLERVEAKLRASEQRSTRILHSIGDAVIVTGPDATVERMNAVAETLTGWNIGEARGRALTEVFHIFNEETRHAVENPVDKVRRLGATVGLANHTVLLSRAGVETHIDDSSAPIWGDHGELAGVVLAFRNISERKAAESLLRTSAEKLKVALETVQLGSWELDLMTGDLVCSTTCKANYGRLPEESLSCSDLMECIHPDDRSIVQDASKRAIETGEVYRAEYRITWPDGSRHWILASGRILRDQSGTPVSMVGVTLDATERHQAAIALIQSEKLAAVGRLASSIAHEINNPLESLTNLLYLMRDSTELSELKSYVDTAERELRRASAITSQTLRFHKQSSQPIPISFADLLDGVLSVYQGKLLNSGVRVEVRNRASSPIACFEGEIRQVLSNLIGNAIDAMQPQGGTLKLRSRVSTRANGNQGLTITVADTGAGMSPRSLLK